jgi:hypothetical protein
MSSESKYYEFVEGLVKAAGGEIFQYNSQPDDNNVRFNDCIIFVFSIKSFKMVSVWQITDYVANQINVNKGEFEFRKVNMIQFPYRLTFSFSDVNNPKAREIMEKIVQLSCR